MELRCLARLYAHKPGIFGKRFPGPGTGPPDFLSQRRYQNLQDQRVIGIGRQRLNRPPTDVRGIGCRARVVAHPLAVASR